MHLLAALRVQLFFVVAQLFGLLGLLFQMLQAHGDLRIQLDKALCRVLSPVMQLFGWQQVGEFRQFLFEALVVTGECLMLLGELLAGLPGNVVGLLPDLSQVLAALLQVEQGLLQLTGFSDAGPELVQLFFQP